MGLRSVSSCIKLFVVSGLLCCDRVVQTRWRPIKPALYIYGDLLTGYPSQYDKWGLKYQTGALLYRRAMARCVKVVGFFYKDQKFEVNSPRGGVLPSKGLLGMCRWMGSHFHNWTDYNGVGALRGQRHIPSKT